MKIFKTILKSIAILLVGAAAFTSCKNDVDNTEAYLDLRGASIQRSVKAEYEITDFNNYELRGIYNFNDGTEREFILGNWNDYYDMLDAYIPIPYTGIWTFTLNASKSGTKFSNSVQKNISTGSNSISFQLKPVEYGKEGSGSVKVGVQIKNLPFDVTVAYNYSTNNYDYIFDVQGYEVVSTCDSQSALSKTIPLNLLSFYDSWGYKYSDYNYFGTSEGTYSYIGDFSAFLEADNIPANDYQVVFHLNKGSLKDIKKQSVIITVTDEMLSKSDSEIDYDYNDPDPIIGIAAVLDACNYTIAYELNGGTIDPAWNLVYNYSSLNENDVQLPTAGNISKFGYSFQGWYTTETFDYDTEISEIKGNGECGGDLTLYAKWEIENYSITYNFGNGYTYSWYPTSYTVETPNVEFPTPTANQSGYEFKGWYTSTDFDPESRIRNFEAGDYAENLVLYALYGEISYKVYYNTNNGNLPEEYDDEFDEFYVTSDTITLPTPTRTAYNFDGWFTSEYLEDYTQISEIVSGSHNDITVYAKWTPINYNITYYNYYGSGYDETDTYTIEDSVTLPTPTLAGYDFAGWYTTVNFEYNTEINEITLGSFGDVEVWARWTTIGYEINFYDYYGPSSSSYNIGYVAEDLPLVLPTPTKPGYDFNGWYSTQDYILADLQTELPEGSTGTQEYYAQWFPINYTITYNTNGGSITDYSYYTSYQITSNTFSLPNITRTGYDFAGWYTTEDFYSGTEISEITSGSTGDIEVWARWTTNDYSIIYYDYYGNGDDASDSYTIESDDITFSAPPSLIGYTFDGWYTGNDYSVSVTGIPSGSYGDVEVYAKWSPTNYTITYHNYYGSGYDETDTYTIEDSVTLPTPTLAGYDFAGWYITSIFASGTEITEIPAGTYGNVEYYAKWLAQNYSITYHTNDGSISGSYPTAFSGLIDIELPTPTRTGYIFDGWYTSEYLEDYTQISEIVSGTSTDVEVWAKWIALEPAVWIKSSTNGSYYFTQSGNVWTSSGYSTGTNNISATTTWTITLVQEATVSIPWTVSSESDYDKLTITVDNVTQVDAVSGEKNGTIELTLNAGTHTVTATYSKDTSQYSGSDCGTLTLNPVTYN